MTVRMGHIRFLNCYPMYCGLEQRGHLDEEGPGPGRPAFELVPGVPTELNQLAGERRDRPRPDQLHRLRPQLPAPGDLAPGQHLVVRSRGQHPTGHAQAARGHPQRRSHHPERHLGGLAQDHVQAALQAGRRLRRPARHGRPGPRGVRRGARHRRPGAGGPLLPRAGHDLPRPRRHVDGLDPSAHGLRGLGRPGGFRPHERRRAGRGGAGVDRVPRLRPRPSARRGGVGARAVPLRAREPDALLRPALLRLQGRVPERAAPVLRTGLRGGRAGRDAGVAVHRRGGGDRPEPGPGAARRRPSAPPRAARVSAARRRGARPA